MEKQTVKGCAYDKNLTLLREYREGNAAAGEELATLNRPLVYSIAGRFYGRGADMDDLIECGNIGLVKAINTFDFSRECAFSTYAVPLIFGEIRRFLRDDGILKVSREEKRLYAVLNAERERRLSLGLDAGVRAVAEAVGVSPEDAAGAFFAGSAVRSLEEAAYDEEGATLGSLVFDEEQNGKDFEKIAIRCAIDKLSEGHKKLIILRYFRDLSQAQTAKILGLTQVKVSREEKKILALLRRELA